MTRIMDLPKGYINQELSCSKPVFVYVGTSYLRVELFIYFFNNIYIYIYIVIHRQSVSFYQNSSVWLDTQDARSRDRNASNFTLD